MSDIKSEGFVLLNTICPSKTEKGRKFAVIDDSDILYVKLFNKSVTPSRKSNYAEKYTRHAFRRSSALIMANSGMSVDELKRQVGWKSSSVASGKY